MGCGGSKSAVRALNQNTKHRLSLEGYGITPQVMCDIAASLELNTSVIHLNLSDNLIGPEGAVALGAALEQNKTLETLLLEGTNIGEAGLVALASGLKKNVGLLAHLVITEAPGIANSAKFGDEGVCALAEALKVNNKLTHLRLVVSGAVDSCEKGTRAMASMIESNGTLKVFDFACREIRDDAAAAFAAAIGKNEGLEVMVFCAGFDILSRDKQNTVARAVAGAIENNGQLEALEWPLSPEGNALVYAAWKGNIDGGGNLKYVNTMDAACFKWQELDSNGEGALEPYSRDQRQNVRAEYNALKRIPPVTDRV